MARVAIDRDIRDSPDSPFLYGALFHAVPWGWTLIPTRRSRLERGFWTSFEGSLPISRRRLTDTDHCRYVIVKRASSPVARVRSIRCSSDCDGRGRPSYQLERPSPLAQNSGCTRSRFRLLRDSLRFSGTSTLAGGKVEHAFGYAFGQILDLTPGAAFSEASAINLSSQEAIASTGFPSTRLYGITQPSCRISTLLVIRCPAGS